METAKKNIYYLRQKNGMTQSDLAKRLNVTQSAITHYESGNRSLNLETLEKLAGIFRVSLDELTGFNRDSSYSVDPEKMFESRVNDMISDLGYFSKEIVEVENIPADEFLADVSPEIRNVLVGRKVFMQDEHRYLLVWNENEKTKIDFDEYLAFVGHLNELLSDFVREHLKTKE